MWQPIETAPKDGSSLQFKNVDNGLTDAGHWDDYSHRPDALKAHWDEQMRKEEGEWSTEFGNGDMTHWRYPE